MQQGQPYNQPQTYGVYFTQPGAQPQFQHQHMAPPNFQTYGSSGPQFYAGQPIVSVAPRFPPQQILPYQQSTAQQYGGQPYMQPPPFQPFLEQSLHHSLLPQTPVGSQQPPARRPQTSPQAQALYPLPGSQGAPNQYGWSTSVTPPSPYYNAESTSPVQQCGIQVPTQVKVIGQYITAQAQTVSPEVGNQNASNFNPDPALLRKHPITASDNKDIFKQKASLRGINIESPPKSEEFESVDNNKNCIVYKNINYVDNNEDFVDIKKNITFHNSVTIPSANVVSSMKSGKWSQGCDSERRSPLTLPVKTVAGRYLEKQKIRDDWWSVSDSGNLSEYRHTSTDVDPNVSLNNNNRLQEMSAYSSFPDSSVDLSKVLAESSVNMSVSSKLNEVFDDSVDYIEEHEFLSYDVTSSPFALNDSDETSEHEEYMCSENRGLDEMPENPLPAEGLVYDKVHSLKIENDRDEETKPDNETIFFQCQKELELSEIKREELLTAGIASNTKIEMLASAIVAGVIAKAVMKVIRADGADAVEKTDNRKIDVESSSDKNVGPNSADLTLSSSPEVTKVKPELNEMKDSEEKIMDNNRDEIRNNKEKLIDNKENVSPMNERHRLYSWPYSSCTEESKNDSSDSNRKFIEVTTPSRATEVEIIVDQSNDSGKQKLSVESSAKTVKTVSESSQDFEKYYFKQKASQHGIKIVSPLRDLKRESSISSESDNDTEKLHPHTKIHSQNEEKSSFESFDRMSRSQSESSDLHSLDGFESQTDPGYIFKQKACKLGIKIQNPKETVELSAENSDAELGSWTIHNKNLHLEDYRRPETSTPEPDKLLLNPESPEFKPGWKKLSSSKANKNEMRVDAPEFNPSSLSTSSSDLNDSFTKVEMRVDAPEFNPAKSSMRATTKSLEALKNSVTNTSKSAKVFHIPTPKLEVEKPAIGIQASPETSDCSVNTRKVKTKDSCIETTSCNSREVCVNTDLPGNTGSYLQPIKLHKHFASKNTNTDIPKRRSIAVSVNIGGGYQEKRKGGLGKTENVAKMEIDNIAIVEQIKALQTEVMKHRAYLHMNRIFLMQNKIQKETKSLTESLKFSNDRQAQDTIWLVANTKLNMLEETAKRINAILEETVGNIKAGFVYQTLPDFTFFSDDPEQNRVQANEQLFDMAVGAPVQDKQPPITINFSPTNKNFIEFTAKANPNTRTPQWIKRNTIKGGSTVTATLAEKMKPTPVEGRTSPVKGTASDTPESSKKSSNGIIHNISTAKNDEVKEAVMVVEDKDQLRGGLMDLDLDSDDEVTEVSTALTDYDNTSLNAELYVDESNTKYVTEKTDLKDIISFKMNEVYAELKDNSDHSSGNKEENTEDKTSTRKEEDSIMNEEVAALSHGTDEHKNMKRTDTDLEIFETEKINIVMGDDEDEIMERTVVSELDSESNVNKLALESGSKNDAVNLDEGSEINADQVEKVSENWENIEIDKDEVYVSPESHANIQVKLDKEDSSAPKNPFSGESLHLAESSPQSFKGKTCSGHVTVSKDNSREMSDIQNIQLPNESRVKPEIKASSVSLGNPVMSASFPLNSSSLLASSGNIRFSSALPLIQPASTNVMAQPLLMSNINPMLYQMVVAQLIRAYPRLAANTDMLSQIALQQTSLLQHYLATGQISNANVSEAFLQGGGEGLGMIENPGQAGVGSPPDSIQQIRSTQTEAQIPCAQTVLGSVAQTPATRTVLESVVQIPGIGVMQGSAAQIHGTQTAQGSVAQIPCTQTGLVSVAQKTQSEMKVSYSSYVSNTNNSTDLKETTTKTNADASTELTAIQSSDSSIKTGAVSLKVLDSLSNIDSSKEVDALSYVVSSRELDAVKSKVSSVKADTQPRTQPVTFRPPSLEGNLVISPTSTMFESTDINKISTTISQLSQHPFSSANKELAKLMSSVSSSSHVRPNPPNLNSNNSASELHELRKPLRRPFKQYVPVSKSTDVSHSSSRVVYDRISTSSSTSGLSDFNEPVRQAFKSNSHETKQLNDMSVSSNTPVSFINVTVSKPAGVSQSSMQSFKPAISDQCVSDIKTPLLQNSAATSSKPPDFLPQYAKRHSPELRDKPNDAHSQDLLPGFVKMNTNDANNLIENQQSFQSRLPPRFRRMSAPQSRQSSVEEDWDEEIEEYPQTKMMKVNLKRELHVRSSSSRKPVSNDTLWHSSSASQMKNTAADSTNPLLARSTSLPKDGDQGSSGLSDIPLPKKLRTSEDKINIEGGEGKEEEWCEVTTKKKKQKELKKFSAPYVNSAPVKTQAERLQIQSNFERLVEKIQEKYPSINRAETLESITKLREQNGGTLKGMNLQDIVSQAGRILEQLAKIGKPSAKPKIPGFRPSQKTTLPKLNLPTANPTLFHHEDEDICVICHDPLSMEETKALDCKHVFHSDCINQWVYGRERTCPTCRQHALFPEEFPRLGK